MDQNFNSIDLDHLADVVRILKDAGVDEATVAGVHIKFRAPEPEVVETSTPTLTKRDAQPKNPYAEVLGQMPPTWTSTQKTQ
jgi:hypothetical protein